MASSSSTSSSKRPKRIYDVVLSFRGEDIRNSFASHLYAALRQAGIHAFMDDKELERGEEISRSLLQAIEGSQIALVILSPNYASSRWCLNELVKIMECQKTQGQRVMPVFHGVDPSDVRHQRGSYGEAIEKHEHKLGRGSDRVSQWRKALEAVANTSGFDSAFRDEAYVIKGIVDDVLVELNTGDLIIADHPVGIESRLHDLTIEWSKKRSRKVLIIGLWGMGGAGKTTVAKAIYNEIGRHFKRSFLKNIREISKQDNGHVILQKQLIYDITGKEVFKICDIDRGKKIIQDRFPHIKALVVLDDVDSICQLNALCESREWFCPRSVIIITTRDMHLLNVLKADYKYEVREMDESESLELFSWHAFKKKAPFEEFMELSRSVVAYCGGLPLALEVIGSYLCEKTIQQWKAALSKLERIPHKDIQAKLKISFDGLDDYTEKEIFLDICCFFINRDRNYVTQILDGCGLHAENGLQILIDRSLIKVSRNNKLEMHDLLRDMGREIIRDSPPKDPEEYSRLWIHEDVLEVLREHTGTKAIEGISLKFPRTYKECLIDSEAFKAMNKLRLLQLDYVNLKGDYKHLSKKLRWLCWHGFPLKYIPNNFHQKNLVAIDFKCSRLVRVWKEPQLLERLKTINLSHSSYLTQTPEFTKLPNLEKLILKDCPSLMLVHNSIGDLENLLVVNLKGCKCLRLLPRSIYKLKSLKTLILSGCSLIDHLEEDFEQMESLTVLMADNTAITQAPRSLARLQALVHGYVSLCGYEGRAQDVFPSLIQSWMSPTNIFQSHSETFLQGISSLFFSAVQIGSFHGLSPFLGNLAKLRGMWEECRPQFQFSEKMARLLDALYQTNFMELESTSRTPQISYMEASASSFEGHVQVFIASSADSFNSLFVQMGLCTKVDLLKDKILQGWSYGGWDDSQLPGNQYPNWFIYKGEGCSVIFKVPLVKGCRLKAMLLNVVHSSCMDNTMPDQFLISVLIINHTKATVQHYKGDSITFHEDEQCQSIISNIQPDDLVELVFSIGPQFPVKKIAAYLIFDDSKPRRLLK